MKLNFLKSLRTLLAFGFFFLIASCGQKLSEARAIELIRLNYKQQSTVEGAGKWLLDSVVVDEITTIKGDTPSCAVLAHTTGLYRVPSIEDAPHGLTESFKDTLTFVATRIGKDRWKASQWVIVAAQHE